MKELFILVHGYDNEKSNNPNALCLYDMISILELHFKLKIITTTTNKKAYCLTKYGNIDVHYIPIYFKSNGKFNFKKWEKEVLDILSKNLVSDKKPRLLTISFPFDILRVGLKAKHKHPQLNWAIYELDPFAYNLVLRFPKIMFIYRYLLEKRTFKSCNQILLTHELDRQYSKNLYKNYCYKFNDVGIPILKISKEIKLNKSKDYIDLVYIGSFYKKIREPNYMLKIIFGLVKLNKNIRLHVYGPEIEHIPIEFRDKYKENIYYYGRVSKEEVNKAIEASDILVNIGNSIENQLPSKVLEYIGTGKPIVNFFSIKKDSSNLYLNKYPLSLLIFEDWSKIQDNIVIANEFVINNYKNKIDGKLLNEIFNEDTLENVTDKIIKTLS